MQPGLEANRPVNAEAARPSVSIVIPCHNYGRFLAEALESALGQTRPADEVIVVDDGSTDDSVEVVNRYVQDRRLRIISQPQQGAIAAYNRGVRESSGDFFLILSADDRLDARYLERTVPLLAAHSKAAYVYTAYRMFGARHRLRTAPPYDAQLLARRPYIVATALMRRAAFDQAGGFSAAMVGGHEDWEFYVMLAEHGWRGLPLPEVLFHYRKHSSTSRNALSFRQWVGVRRRVYTRHRTLYRMPLRAYLGLTVLDQQWLRLKAAPRAILRRLTGAGGTGRRAGSGLPRVSLVGATTATAWRSEAHSSMLAGRFKVAVAATPCSQDRPPLGAYRLASQVARARADLYHAYDPVSLLVASLAAIRHRAVLLYDRPVQGMAGQGLPVRAVEWAVRWRLDGVTYADPASAASVQGSLGIPPLVLEDGTSDPETDAERLRQLYSDLLGSQPV